MEPDLSKRSAVNGKQSPQLFIEGHIPMNFIAEIIQQYGHNPLIGAYSIFMGQVRGDESGGSVVKAIEYTAHIEMAVEKLHEIKTALSEKYHLTNLLAYHSLGLVNTGEICFFVLVASGHRNEAFRACNEAVERIKAEIPVWGKLMLANETIQWKDNNPL